MTARSSSAWLEATGGPDIERADGRVTVQRHNRRKRRILLVRERLLSGCELNISCATGVFDALENSGEAVDRKGDALACGGEYSRRHHRVLRRGMAMTRAVAIGQVVQGDKEKPELTDMINTTCAVDLAELEGDEATGADVCQEYKVVAPLTKSRRMGRGSVLHAARSHARSPTSATFTPSVTRKSATGLRSWAARAKAPWASTVLSITPPRSAVSRNGRETMKTLSATRRPW